MLKHVAKYILRPDYRKLTKENQELDRISQLPRFTPSTANLLNHKIFFSDSASFVFMYREIFRKEIYNFKTSSAQPLIIDAGANIGMGVLYFKKKFPQSKVIAFEPDQKVASILRKNVDAFELNNVEVIEKGLWKDESFLEFQSDGADTGRVADKDNNSNTITISTTKLSKYLDQPVDFLKIDIEGAEIVVLQECQEKLQNVKNIFVEYHSLVNAPQKLEKLLQILAKAGFRYYIDNTSFLTEQPLIHRREEFGMDLQLNIFGLKK